MDLQRQHAIAPVAQQVAGEDIKGIIACGGAGALGRKEL